MAFIEIRFVRPGHYKLMPCIVKLRVVAGRFPSFPPAPPGRNAMVCVDIAFGPFPAMATEPKAISNGSVNWGDDFRYEVTDDALLQDHPVEFTVRKTMSLHSSVAVVASQRSSSVVGVLRIDLNPLLAVDSPYSLSGWFPLAGDSSNCKLSVQCKLQFFGDSNPFKESSAGVQFFSHPGLPKQHAAIIGLVDLEITSQISVDRIKDVFNRWLYQVSGQLRRQLGRKVLEMGGNAVLAFKQYVDVESKSITVRGLGTAAKLFPEEEEVVVEGEDKTEGGEADNELERHPIELQSPTGTIDLLTLSKWPPRTILSIGGIVSAKAVKLVSDVPAAEHPDCRDKWLNQLREEIRGHARTLNCTAVIGYEEELVVGEGDLLILCAAGTAARIDLSAALPDHVFLLDGDDPDEDAFLGDAEVDAYVSKLKRRKRRYRDCLPCHIPYKRHQAPFESAFTLCRLCGRRYVPQILLSSIDPPSGIDFLSDIACSIEAMLCKPIQTGAITNKRRQATAVSSVLPFVEYDLHRQLICKLRLFGCNAIFGLKYRLAITNNAVVAVVMGTAVFLAALPQPPILKVSRTQEIVDEEDRNMLKMQESLVQRSQDAHDRVEGILTGDYDTNIQGQAVSASSSSTTSSSSTSSAGSSDEEATDAMAVVQIDDDADEDLIGVLEAAKADGGCRIGTIDMTCGHLTGYPRHLNVQFSELSVEPSTHHPTWRLSESLYGSFSNCEFDCGDCQMYCHVPHLVSSRDSLGLFSLSALQCSSEHESGAEKEVLLTTGSSVPGHRIVDNYGQVTFHFCHSCHSIDPSLVTKSLWQREVEPMLFAYVKALGGNALLSIRCPMINTRYTDDGDDLDDDSTKTMLNVAVSVAGDVASIIPEQRSPRGSFSSPGNHLMIGHNVL